MTNKLKTSLQIILGGIIVYRGKILLLQRHKREKIYPELWELPSGKKEPGEEMAKALQREIKEETNLRIKVFNLVNIFSYTLKNKDQIKEVAQINFLVKPLNNQIRVKLSLEHQDFVWVTLDQLKDYNLSREAKKSIKEAFRLIQR